VSLLGNSNFEFCFEIALIRRFAVYYSGLLPQRKNYYFNLKNSFENNKILYITLEAKKNFLIKPTVFKF
jgi:hypothetical protein